MKTPNEFLAEMVKIRDMYNGNTESQHKGWDKLMENLLIELGYEEGVKIARNGDKSYSRNYTQWE